MMKLFFAIGVAMASATAAEIITWDASVVEASKGNADVRSYRDALRAAELESKAAFGAFLPEISGNLAFDRGDAGSGTTNSYTAALSGRQNLFSGFQDRARLERALARRDLASADLDEAKARASYDLKSAYAGLLYALESVKLSDDIERRREANFQLVELRFEGGRENKGSYYLSKSSLSQARFDSLKARNAVDVGRQQLARALGRDDTVPFEIVGDVPTLPPPLPPRLRSLGGRHTRFPPGGRTRADQ